jgi:hypothetical protein
MFGIEDAAVIGRDLARDQAQERRLARAVAANKPNLVALGNACRRVFEERPPLDAIGKR